MPASPDEGQHPRTLLIGALLPTGRGVDPALTVATGFASSPTLHDFAVIVCRYSNAGFKNAGRAKWEEWGRFLHAGGTAFVVGIEPSLQRHIESVVLIRLEFVRESGRELSWKVGPAIFPALQRRICTKWSLSLARESEKDVVALARNNAGAAVAFQIRVGQGSVVFLPSFDGTERRHLVTSLIRFGEEEWTRHRSGLVLPTWATTVALAAEARITAERVAIEDKLLRIRNARRIIVDKGNSLSRECSRILQEILAPEGFRVTWTEQEGNHDIEMVSATSTVLVQVRGASEGITVELPRQLMHHMQIFRPTTSELKGMMIANAFREVPPDARPPAFSRETVDLAERNSYCAMTTYQLLQVYDGVVAGSIRPADFLARLKATAGVFSMPSAGI